MNKVKQWFFNKLVKHLFNGVTEFDVLYQRKDGTVTLRGKPIPDDVKHSLAEEAIRFQGSYLWRAMKTDLRFLANDRIYNKSSKPDDWLFGKTTLYVVDTLDKLLSRISNFGK